MLFLESDNAGLLEVEREAPLEIPTYNPECIAVHWHGPSIVVPYQRSSNQLTVGPSQ